MLTIDYRKDLQIRRGKTHSKAYITDTRQRKGRDMGSSHLNLYKILRAYFGEGMRYKSTGTRRRQVTTRNKISYRHFLGAFSRLAKRVSSSVRTGSNGPCLEVSVTPCAGSREATQKSRPCEASERRPTRCRGHVRVWRGSEGVGERVVGLDGGGDRRALRLHVCLGVLRGRRRRCYAKQGSIRCQGGKEDNWLQCNKRTGYDLRCLHTGQNQPLGFLFLLVVGAGGAGVAGVGRAAASPAGAAA